MNNATLGRNFDSVSNSNMVFYCRMAAHHHVVSDSCGARYPNLGRKEAPHANLDVVGNVHEVIQCRVITDYRVAQASPIDGDVVADIHVVSNHHSSQLGDFF